jgi:hypothetical protein
VQAIAQLRTSRRRNCRRIRSLIHKTPDIMGAAALPNCNVLF